MLTADKYVHHLVHVQITMAESALYKKIKEAMKKRNPTGDEEALALMTAAVVRRQTDDEVSAISAYITGFFKAERSP